jgi:predicted DNA-binding WGR domain protein
MNGRVKEDNFIAHFYRGTSDKIYMACIRIEELANTVKFVVIGKWGRRGQTLKSQVKWSGNDRVAAVHAQIELFESKLKEGYVDINSFSYNDSVNYNSPYITESLELNQNKFQPEKSKPEKSKPVKKIPLESNRMFSSGDVVVCINNAGIEDKFDLGIDYICEKHSDSQMIYVYDKNGVKGEFFVDRFKKP